MSMVERMDDDGSEDESMLGKEERGTRLIRSDPFSSKRQSLTSWFSTDIQTT